VKAAPAQLEQIGAIQRRLEVRTRRLTETNRDRLRQFDGRDNVARLLGLPARLVAVKGGENLYRRAGEKVYRAVGV
jgi:hypothetical protein